MAKYVFNGLSKKKQEAFLQSMYKAIAKLKNEKEVEKFFRDFWYYNEIVMVSRRLLIAEMLLKGYTRDEIINELKVGAVTVTKVDRWLSRGFGSYRDRVKKEKSEKVFVDYRNHCPLSLDGLAEKYPGHFWLIQFLMGR